MTSSRASSCRCPRSTIPAALSKLVVGHRRGRGRAAHQGFRRRCAASRCGSWCRRSARASRTHYDRPWAPAEKRENASRRDRACRARPRGDRRACSTDDRCICSRPARPASTTSSSRSISVSRRATSRCFRLPTAISPALRRPGPSSATRCRACGWCSCATSGIRCRSISGSSASASHAKVIVVRLLGGLDWWRYGVDRLSALARERGIALAVLPGEDRDDPRLAEHLDAAGG